MSEITIGEAKSLSIDDMKNTIRWKDGTELTPEEFESTFEFILNPKEVSD